ncbi:MAG: SDR family NAD(P)-dependent oxidoreductase [Rhodoferax sp.]|nr:SDR family NAD(P)-dependent oxidoreductase [Rhodoferax sp.]
MAHDGARVVLLDLHPAVEAVAAEINATGRDAFARTIDVSDADSVQTCVEEVQATCGVIDLLVNGAGIVDHISPISRMKPAKWAREIAVNLGGPFNLIRAVAPGMAQRGWGRIVNISSGAARGGLIMQAGYSASKSGLLGLTRNVTLEFARFGVTCNAILPGLIGTEKVLGMPAGILEAGIAATPARRLGQSQEVAALISFLCGQDAGFINGAEIDISGGSHLNTLSLGSDKENRTNPRP